MDDDITIMYPVRGILSHHCRIYYYQGNIFKPMSFHGSIAAQAKHAIRKFYKDNAAMIKADRAKPDYKSIAQLAREQLK